MEEKTLDKFKIDEIGKIKIVNGEGAIRRRLFDMGVTPGAEVKLIKKAPFGDPIEIKIRSYNLTLRKSEAKNIVMETIEGNKTL